MQIVWSTTVLGIASTASMVVSAASSTQTYSVQTGDTLYKIAVANRCSLAALEAANPQVTNFNNIYPGESLNLPSSSAVSSPAPSLTPSTGSPSAPLCTYTVQQGDTLYKISLSQNVSLAALESANASLTNFDSISVGQVLKLPTASSSSPAGSSSIPSISSTPPVSVAPPSSASTTVPASTSLPRSTSATVAKASAQQVISEAMSLIGTPYTWGGDTPSTGFDCSGFVEYVFGTVGITLPRESHDQATVGTPVDQSALQPGDLLFFAYTDSSASLYPNHVTHVGIYMGNGAMIESSTANNNEGVVIVQNVFAKPYYVSHYYGARRVFS